jgi:hypothetical protein
MASAYFEDHPDDPTLVILRKPSYQLDAAPPEPQRKPLTNEHLLALFRPSLDHVEYARAIERAHGIGSEE